MVVTSRLFLSMQTPDYFAGLLDDLLPNFLFFLQSWRFLYPARVPDDVSGNGAKLGRKYLMLCYRLRFPLLAFCRV